jgi:hypothetical protein
MSATTKRRRKKASSTVAPPESKRYLDDRGRVLFVSDGISDGQAWGTFHRKANGSLQRLVSKHLPLQDGEWLAQEDLDNYARLRRLEVAHESPATPPQSVSPADAAAKGEAPGTFRHTVIVPIRPSAKASSRVHTAWDGSIFRSGYDAGLEGMGRGRADLSVSRAIDASSHAHASEGEATLEAIGNLRAWWEQCLRVRDGKTDRARIAIVLTDLETFEANRRDVFGLPPGETSAVVKELVREASQAMESGEDPTAENGDRRGTRQRRRGDQVQPETPASLAASNRVALALAETDGAPLTKTERKTLDRCEKTIQAGQRTFVEVGQALAEIRDQRLYRGAFPSFEAYCKTTWDFGRQYAYRLIGSAEVVQKLSPVGNTLPMPATESQARPLTRVDPDQVVDVWREAVKKAERDESGKPKVTAEIVEATVREWTTPGDELEARRQAEGDRDPFEAAMERALSPVRKLIDRYGKERACRAAIGLELRRLIEESLA